MKYKFLLIIFSLIFASQVAYAVDVANTGIIPGQIWYSQDKLVEGETVNIYTAIWNGSENTVKIKVEFYDKNVVLGSREVSVLRNSMKDVSVSWKVTAGDHLISAKIISSSIMESGKSKTVLLEQRETSQNKQFVAKVIKEIDGTPATSNDIIKNQIDKTTSKIGDVIPDSVQDTFTEKLGFVNDFREEILVKINDGKEVAKKHLDELNKISPEVTKSGEKANTGIDGTDKPITLIKYFLLATIGLIFANKVIFYGLILLILFFILRFIYRKIRRR